MIDPALLITIIASLAVIGALAFLFLRQRNATTVLQAKHDAIDAEEHRMFDFLHGLGSSLQSDSTARAMHRFIVTGVTNVVDAENGTLYLLDKTGKQLVPTFQTSDAPPFIDVPASVLDRAGENKNALQSYLRLQAIPRDQGVLGQAVQAGKALITTNLASLTKPSHPNIAKLQENVPVMVAPLVYGDVDIGAIAVSGKKNATQFTDNDFDVYQSIAEQSSVALGSALIHREAHEKKQLENEIRNASEIQKILLPSTAPDINKYIVSAMNYPAKIVSGDYFDYIRVDDHHWGLVIGDVSGKGIPASLIMAMCRSVIRVHAENNTNPHDVLSAVNRALSPDIREDMFISMAYVFLRDYSDDVTLVRAGHDPPMLYHRASGETELLKPPGLAVGIDGGDVFNRVTEAQTFKMETGDCLLLYTDGVNETLNPEGDEFGLEALQHSLEASASDGANAIVEKIADDLRAFMGDTPQNDDITLIAVEKR
ncbi:MAG: GAF domain-containing SpoIIE family protein phosphatase [Verrucomicrobiota bacterium]